MNALALYVECHLSALGISRVETRRDTTLLVDVTVVLGSDWKAPSATP